MPDAARGEGGSGVEGGDDSYSLVGVVALFDHFQGQMSRAPGEVFS